MRDVIRCALCGDEIEDPIQTGKGELCEKCIAGMLSEQRIVSLPDDVFLKPIVLNEDTMNDRLRQINYTCSNGRCYGSISHKLEPAFSCMYYSFVNEFEIYFRIRVRQGRKEEAVVLGKKLLEEMNTLELDDAWDRDYALSVLQDIIGVKTRIAFFEKEWRKRCFQSSEVLLQAGQVSGQTCTAEIPAGAEIPACLSGGIPEPL